jgi:hypothetical protein
VNNTLLAQASRRPVPLAGGEPRVAAVFVVSMQGTTELRNFQRELRQNELTILLLA